MRMQELCSVPRATGRVAREPADHKLTAPPRRGCKPETPSAPQTRLSVHEATLEPE